MELVKFSGKDKSESVKKAIEFFYDNYSTKMGIEMFLAKCRLQDDKQTLYFYPNLEVDIKKFREFKKKAKEDRKKK